MKNTFSLSADDTIALVACSDGVHPGAKPQIEQLCRVLEYLGLHTLTSPYLYAGPDGVYAGTAAQRAEALTEFYLNPAVQAIFDVSGGDLTNELLEFLDFDLLAAHPKPFAGYSDVTVLLNALFVRNQTPGLLWQIRNLVGKYGRQQLVDFKSFFLEGLGGLCDFPYSFLQGSRMSGIVVGGNLRCFLKLAGTPWFPDLSGKILFLESRSGELPQTVTAFRQLSQLGAFRDAAGILLGTFTQMEKSKISPTARELVLSMTQLPVAETGKIGHAADSKGILIGSAITLEA